MPMALIAIGIGSVFVLPMAISTSSNLVNAQKATQSIKEQYAVNAGLEDAIWNLVWGDFQTTVLNVTGSSTDYTLSEDINGQEVDVNIERVASLPVASDDLDSGGLLGGLNWVSDWLALVDAGVVSSGEPYEGSHHFRIGTLGSASRSVDTSELDEVFLRFWAKASDLQPGDDVDLKISSNGSNWVTVGTWNESDSDGVYRFYEIDLSEYSTSSNFWISFEGLILSAGQFYFDDLSISGADTFEILVSGRRQTAFAKVRAQVGGVSKIITFERDPNPSPTPVVSPTATFTATRTPTITPSPTATPAQSTNYYILDKRNKDIFTYSSEGYFVGSISVGSSFNKSKGIAVNDSNIYLVDEKDKKIYIYSLAGGLLRNFYLHDDNDKATGLDVDNGTIYVVDEKDSKVYKYDVFGNLIGSFGLDAANEKAKGIAVWNGIIYVVDEADNKIYSYDNSGLLTGSFNLNQENDKARGITVQNDLVFVVDESDNTIYKYDTNGLLLSSFSLYLDNDKAEGVSFDGNSIYVIDEKDKKIYKYGPTGNLSGTISLEGESKGNAAWITVSANTVYAVDDKNKKVFVYDSNGAYIRSFDLATDNEDATGLVVQGNTLLVIDNKDRKVYQYSSNGDYSGSFNLTGGNSDPKGIALDGETVYIVDDKDGSVYIYTNGGIFISSFSLHTNNTHPRGIAANEGTVYVVDEKNEQVYLYNSNGAFLGSFNLDNANDKPKGITISESNLYIVDEKDDKVYLYSIDGILQSSFNLTHGSLEQAEGITTDGSTIYITDERKRVIYKFDNNGKQLGNFGLEGDNSEPNGLSIGDGNLFVVDKKVDRVYKYLPDGTALGSFILEPANGNPTGIVVDNGVAYVVDKDENVIYKYNTSGTFLGSLALSNENNEASGIAIDNDILLVTDDKDDKVFQYNTDGTIVGSFNLHYDNLKASGITSTNIVVSSGTPTPTSTSTPPGTPTPGPSFITIDFEGLSAGTIVNSVSSGSGISGDPIAGYISVFGNEPLFTGTNTAMIFDAACPGSCSGADSDLRKPELGKIIIVSEDMDSGDPDDSARANTSLDFDFSTFDSGSVTIESLDALDIEQFMAIIDLYEGGAGGTLLQSIPLPDTGDNGLESVSVGVSGVDFMRVTLNGSGSIDNIVLTTEPIGAPTPTPTPSPTPTVTPTPTPLNNLSSVIDFEGISDGTIVNSVSSNSGISGDTVSGSISVFGSEPTFPGINAAMIFNATCPGYCSGGDTDLDKPELGKIIIVSEDMDSGDPDDTARYGAYFDFDFSAFGSGTVTVGSIDVLDIEQTIAKIDLYQGGENGTLIQTVPLPQTSDNGLATVNVGVSDVDFMRVTLHGSGAIDNIAVTTLAN